MRVCLIQFGSALGEAGSNVAAIDRLIRSAADAAPDTVVLPELWNTGFLPPDLSGAEDDRNGPAYDTMRALAGELGLNVVGGSILVRENGRLFNRTFIFDRSGQEVGVYDKMHLFSPMGEDKHIAPGREPCRFELDGVPCGCLTCYDLRFPELARTLAFGGAKALFVAAQWPLVRVDAWRVLLRARAIENQLFVVACNGCGAGSSGAVAGHSMVVGPAGSVLWEADEQETVSTVRLDPSEVDSARAELPAFPEAASRRGEPA